MIATEKGLDFDLLSLRIHPAASRVAMLAEETPASFVAFDLLAEGDDDLRGEPFKTRRARLERAFKKAKSPILLTPATTDPDLAGEWFDRFEGAGLDGVVAKPLDGEYREGERTMAKVKHLRTADCAVAGYRVHKDGEGVGSLLLGLFDEHRRAAPRGRGEQLQRRAAQAARRPRWSPTASTRSTTIPGATGPKRAADAAASGQRMPGGLSRWNAGKDLSWEPLRVELVAEVAYEHLQGDRFRHTARFQRWRPDREPVVVHVRATRGARAGRAARGLRSMRSVR